MVNLDIEMAQLVVQMDNKVDRIQQDVYDRVKQALRSCPEQTGYLLNLLLISRHLERPEWYVNAFSHPIYRHFLKQLQTRKPFFLWIAPQ